MLLKHGLSYVWARGIPALFNFAAIVIYTRLLSPEDYGRYTLVIAGIGLLNILLFQWIRVSLLRFYPAHIDNPKPLLSAVVSVFVVQAALVGLLGLALAWVFADQEWTSFLILGVPLLWAQAWFDLNLELARSQLQPLRYGMMSGVKAVSALGIGFLLVLWGAGAHGPLIGILVGMLVAGIGLAGYQWRGLSFVRSSPLTKDMMRYGLPLTATFALAFVMHASDRFLIAGMIGEGAVGSYSASYDIAQQSLTTILMVVNLAAYPLLIRAFELQGMEAAKQQARKNATVLLAIGIPACVGFWMLAKPLAGILLGEAYRADAAYLLPIVASAALLAGLKSYHFDLAFQLGHWTVGQIWVLVGAALVNVVLNLWLIPDYGLLGAAYATVAAYVWALLISALWGRRVFVMPFPWPQFVQIAGASALMAIVLSLLSDLQGAVGLAAQVSAGVGIYAAACLLINLGEARTRFVRLVKRYQIKQTST